MLSQGRGATALSSASDKYARFMQAMLASRTSRSMFVHPGDEREVIEIPSRISFKNGEQIIEDTIHNDVSLDHDYFQSKLKELLPPLSSFKSPKEFDSIEQDNFVLFPPTMAGFVLSARKWILFQHRCLVDPEHNNHLWQELQLPKGYKQAIMAAVQGHKRPGKGAPDLDVLPGKGAGCIILLQGTSGAGKTFTAEALALKLNKPLYSITGSDLGDSISTVDSRLNTILNHGRRWGCVMLLDEADIYLARRLQDSLTFNSIVGTFLRQLDWFPGIMVLTTNLGNIDPAIVDRCQLRLELPPLNKQAISKLWGTYCQESRLKTFISESAAKDLDVRLDKGVQEWLENKLKDANSVQVGVSQQPWTGREIQHILRSAAGLAIHKTMRDKHKQAKRSRKRNTTAEETRKASKLTEGDQVLVTVENLDDAYSIMARFKLQDGSDEFRLSGKVDENLKYGDESDSELDEISSEDEDER